MKEIRLTQGKVTRVSDQDYEWLNQWRWFAHERTYTYYVGRGVRLDNGKQGMVSMHRFILQAPKGTYVDHRDGNGLNNQRDNIRLCTNRENHRNARPYENTSSRFKGVYWHKRDERWVAAIKFDGKQKSLGYFTDEVDAARAYDEAARKHFGEFARTNF